MLEKLPLEFGPRGRGLVEWILSFDTPVTLARAVYDLFPEYEENSIVPRPPQEWDYVSRRIETIRPAPIHSPILSNIRWIKAVSGFSDAEIGALLNVEPKTVSMWNQGLTVPDFKEYHVSQIYDVLKTAERRHATKNSMRVWLTSLHGDDMKTPAQMLAAHEYDKARFRAIGTSWPGGELISRSSTERSRTAETLSRSSEVRDDHLTPNSEISVTDLFGTSSRKEPE